MPTPGEWLGSIDRFSRAVALTGWQGMTGLGSTAPGASEGRRLVPASLELLRVGTRVVSALAPGSGWRELANKLDATGAFFAGPPRDPPGERGLWGTEALGYRRLRERPREAWGPDPLGHRAAASWERLPLHTGAGLALASSALGGLPPRPASRAVAAALRRFAADCATVSRPGYAEATFEALGLVGRNLHPRLVPAVDAALTALGTELRELFWHGAGRGAYFAPCRAWPGSWGAALERLERDAPDEAARVNGRAGLAWALVLVNRRHPEIVAATIDAHRTAIEEEPAFVHGVVGAWLVARSAAVATGDGAFLATRPAGPLASDAWRRLVVEPCTRAAGSLADVLHRTEAWGGLFRVERTAAGDVARPWADGELAPTPEALRPPEAAR